MRKPRYYDSLFGEAVRRAYNRGEMSYSTTEEWDKKYNGGVAPNPPFNTKEIIEYYGYESISEFFGEEEGMKYVRWLREGRI